MDVQIDEIVSSVRAVDSQSMLAPRTLAAIVRAVKEALADADRRDQQARSERRVTATSREHIDEE